MFRIQKLMLEEFREIYEPVIVENPFTQVTDKGLGIRQYHIGLTPTKLVFGCDDFDQTDLDDVGYHNMDPEIETFQLVSLLPLQFLQVKFFRKQGRCIMRLCIVGDEDKPMFFEFGGHMYKNLFWNTWRERIATIRLAQPILFHISGCSPFSSTDVLLEEEEVQALVHSPPLSIASNCVNYSQQ
ncbi:PREDICTED: uncharacterized protein LOC108971389 [Bactrocera latifrons]|uniref:Uncharacterized protein n=1 Tax=Bactrocera latifrons TaxID=174628 RepID=A0A0K8UA33_BACLA|nr:PREDICTED: uncharacterized protein LOC108971389 [Bactrocera latifrons]